MLSHIGFKELATEKTLTFDPTPTGLRVFLRNAALEERMHMDLNAEDLALLARLIQSKLDEIGSSVELSIPVSLEMQEMAKGEENYEGIPLEEMARVARAQKGFMQGPLPAPYKDQTISNPNHYNTTLSATASVPLTYTFSPPRSYPIE